MQFVDNGGVRIAWEQHGSGPPLLLIMGHRWSQRMWHPLLDTLRAHFRVIAFDNRGSGQSDAPAADYTISDMARDAVRVLDAAEVPRAHVFGVSLGGVVAQDLAVLEPDRVNRLVLGCTGAITDGRLRLTRARRLNYYLPDRIVNALGRPLLYGGIKVTPAIREDLRVLSGERTTRHGLLGQATAVSTHAVDLADLRALPHPTLVLHGGKDKVVPPAWGRELADLIPDSRYVLYPLAGHNFMVTHADETCTDVIGFLQH
jgi:3-oxoadipate enol-lactonase